MSLYLLSYAVSRQTLIVRAYIEPNKSAPQQTPTPQKAPETLTKKQRQHAAKREAELRAMHVVVPPGDEAKPISCPICKELLKSEFLEDDEEWVWRNAIKKDDRVRGDLR